MAKRQYREEEMRAELLMRLRGRRQNEVADEMGVSSAYLSQVKTGYPMSDKVLAWMGYERAEKLYAKRPKEEK